MQLFVELLQVAIGNKELLSRTPSPKEWSIIFQLAQEQAVSGFLFTAIEKLSQKGQKPTLDILYEWIAVAERVKTTNKMVNKQVVKITEMFRREGIKTCILKGQGNAMMYPSPLMRTSGDIDVWTEVGKEDIRKFVRSKFPNAEECGWHIDFPVFSDTPVEVHFIPSYSRHPSYDKKLQCFFRDKAKEQFSNFIELPDNVGVISVPTWEFNVVQQLSHVMRHFFVEGIALRQIMDLYYLILSRPKEIDPDMTELLKYLGMIHFAEAVMWVLHEIFGMKEQYLIAPMHRKRGRTLFKEILQGGNWGRFDKRIFGRGNQKTGMLPYLVHSSRLIYLFPEETIITGVRRKLSRI